MDELKPCPFCDGKSSVRRKIESKTILKQNGRLEYGYESINYAHRFGMQPFCTKCFAKLPYVWGDWHEEDGAEYGSKCLIWRYADKGELDEIRNRAIEAWNRRATDADGKAPLPS